MVELVFEEVYSALTLVTKISMSADPFQANYLVESVLLRIRNL